MRDREKPKRDLRVTKTLDAIDAALHRLVLERSPRRVTVAELCRQARINKKTFYLHYSSLDALFQAQLERMTASFLEQIKELRLPAQLFTLNREFFLFSFGQGEFYDRIICSEAYGPMGLAMLAGFVEAAWSRSEWFNALDRQVRGFVVTFLLTTGHALYKQWVLEGKKMPLEEAIEISGSLLCEGVKGIRKNSR